ncbi:hypothetical protein FHL15_009955 [Xylaria flabelliformis]|uniref:Uncharacterized protein n=1 Tax=Xylaria flabelliformis TaxID=2512241 RepID=A0A553HMF5_9PEZI|nr:hypothetical protein FHL15_009955 [Xylaria flabelliformis]
MTTDTPPQTCPASRKLAYQTSSTGAHPGLAAREKRIRPSRDPAETTKFGRWSQNLDDPPKQVARGTVHVVDAVALGTMGGKPWRV